MNEEKVLKAIQVALDTSEGSISLGSSSQNIELWDSLGHLSVLQELDKLFEGKIASIEEMASADSVEKILALLRKHFLI